MKRALHIDFESRSEVDLTKRGLDVYARHPSTKPLMLGWAIDEDEPKLWLPEHGKFPAKLKDAFNDPDTYLVAQNAQFEEALLTHKFKAKLDPRRWRDTMIMGYYCALPGNLEELCRVVGVDEADEKDSDGRRLINLFCIPRKNITKTYPQRWLDKHTHPEDWEKFCRYCIIDVKAERAVYKKLLPFDLPEREYRLMQLDRQINLRGFPVDRVFVANALSIYKNETIHNIEHLKQLTGLANPMSAKQMLEWARAQGYPYNDMKATTVKRALGHELPPLLTEVLEIRAGTYKASLKKYDALRRTTGEGYRFRYGFQFMGASRTARWAGRKVQVQNLPRLAKAFEGKVDELTEAVRNNDIDTIKKEGGNPILVLSSLVRSSFRAPPGKHFVVADLSAIEDRVIGWLSGCEKILQEHRDKLDPYKAFGVYLYGKPYDAITKQERQDAKPGKLGCGYRLGPGGTVINKKGDEQKTGLFGYADNMGIKLTLEQCERSVQVYRETYPEVKYYWYNLENAVERCIRTRQPVQLGHCIFDIKPPFLRIRLPSGRHLHYFRPRLTEVTRMGRDNKTYTKLSFNYWGVDSQTKKWQLIWSHGGKIAENIDQAVARDILSIGMERAASDGYTIDAHAHDEIISEEPIGSYRNAARLSKIMAHPISWCKDLPLAAAGYESLFYKKE